MSELYAKTAVIGVGYWGKNHVRKFHELGALVAIADHHPENRKNISEQYDVPVRSIEEIIADPGIEAVVIATPAYTHAEIALKAIAAKKHVFVEKPIALTVEDAEKICNAADEAGVLLMVGHLLQYHPCFLKLKELVLSGEFGKIRHIYSRRNNIGIFRPSENVLWNLAPHDISMILALAKCEPKTVEGFSGNYLLPHISDFATVHLKFENNINAQIDVSWLNPVKEQRLVVVLEKGMLVFDDTVDWEQKLMLYRHKAAMAEGRDSLLEVDREGDAIEVEYHEPLLNECEHFLKFIQRGEVPYTDGHEALAVLKILQSGDVAQRTEPAE